MQTEYTLTFSDYRAAQWLYLKTRPLSMCMYIFGTWVIPSIALAGFFLYVWSIETQPSEASASLLSNIQPMLIFGAISPFLYRWAIWNGYKNQIGPDIKSILSFSFNHERFIATSPSRTESKVEWSAITNFVEDKKVSLFFFSKTRFMVLPKRTFPEEIWSTIRNLAKQRFEPYG